MTSSNESATLRFHLIRINDQQDFLFVRLGVDKKQSFAEGPHSKERRVVCGWASMSPTKVKSRPWCS